MRIVILGPGGVRNAESGIARAARGLGHDVRLIDIVRWRRRLGRFSAPIVERLALGFAPDLILASNYAWRLGEERLRRLFKGRRSAFWFHDPQPHPGTLELARLVDEFYVTYHGKRDLYRKAGVSVVRFLPPGLDPELERPGTPREEYRCEVSFTGSGHYPYRWEILRTVAAVAKLQIRGVGWDGAPPELPVVGGPVYGKQLADVIASAAISLGADALPAQTDDYASASDRMWKIFGCGGYYLGAYIPGIEHFAADGVHCGWYRSHEEAVAKIRAALADPAARQQVAEAGRAHALAHHTYAHRLELLLAGREYQIPGAP